ncbi:M20/M25/M40 family metallo-hydrolase [Psychromicrobium xiongbiense]|uniref:M20/M25/M40 family metallo-hydrolase n=1 Tax=Psychromicrobium xiongbiense TaxID=3051184 RepID=UPI002553DB2F|nr:M20/M25/M40 family metallo-hydrolase [Psychromicrobium sp. YIM S02556]
MTPAVHPGGPRERLSALIQIPTVSRADPELVDQAAFERFITAIEAFYPLVHRSLSLERVNGQGLLFRWTGRRPEQPTVLMAHYDVVPVLPEDHWTHPAFSGHDDGEFIWGRGTLDDKACVAAILEAVEAALGEGFVPAHDVYLSFGNNEETHGSSARRAAELLAERGVRPWLVLDEGGAVVSEAFPGVSQPIAMVGIAEKGTLDVELSVHMPGGHSSMPARWGATARLARAILRLEKHPFPARLPQAVRQMLTALAPLISEERIARPLGALLSREGLMEKPLTALLTRLSPETNALVRTTAVTTTLRGSQGANVLASTATAGVNIRIAPGETVDGVLERLKRVIRDPAVAVRKIAGGGPSLTSRTDHAPHTALSRAIAEAFPGVPQAPYLMMGATDSRYFAARCDAVYRFAPFRMNGQLRATIHGVNERIPVSSYLEGIGFYGALLRQIANH